MREDEGTRGERERRARTLMIDARGGIGVGCHPGSILVLVVILVSVLVLILVLVLVVNGGKEEKWSLLRTHVQATPCRLSLQ
jgi:hypothetical protein